MKAIFRVILFVALCYSGYKIHSSTSKYVGFRQAESQTFDFKKRLTNIDKWVSYFLDDFANEEEKSKLHSRTTNELLKTSQLYTFSFLATLIVLGLISSSKTHFNFVVLLAVWFVGFTTPLIEIEAVSHNLKIEISEQLNINDAELKGKTFFFYTSKSLFATLKSLLESSITLFVILIIPSVIIPLLKIFSFAIKVEPAFISKIVLVDVLAISVLTGFITINSTTPQVNATLLSGFYVWLTFSVILIHFSLKKQKSS
jgi:hypothetical protein